MKLISTVAVILSGALASGAALAGGHGHVHGGSFVSHGGHANFHGARFASHGGGHGGHGGFGVFIGPPLLWPWYYPPAYYYPPTYAYNPPVYYTNPTVVVTPSSPTYYPPAVAPPGSPGNPIVELPRSDTYPQQAPAQQPSNQPAAQPQSGTVVAQGPPTQLFMYPRQGQDEQQQARDRDECYHWALAQIGYDASKASPALSSTQTGNYYRAMEACLDGRGYSVR